MLKRIIIISAIIFVLTMLSVFVGINTEKELDGITVSILPQKYFLERIAGEQIDKINVMIPPGESPATYEPTPKQIEDLANSAIYFRIGHVPFETAWMNRFISVNSKMKVVDTSKGVDLIIGEPSNNKEEIQKDEHHHNQENNHYDENAHSHDQGINPHIWLSPEAVKIQARHIYETLIDFDKDNSEEYLKNYQKFVIEIDNLKSELEKELKNLDNRNFISYHPSWTYFARDFGLNQHSLEFDGKEVTPAQLQRLIKIAKDKNIEIIFVQKQFPIDIAKSVSDEIDGQLIHLNPLNYNWFEGMRGIVDALKEKNNGKIN